MNKQEKHEKILSFLDSYFKDTPRDVILSEIREVSNMEFEGTSAKDYFLNFHKHYHQIEGEIPPVRLNMAKPRRLSKAKVIFPRFKKETNRKSRYSKVSTSIETALIPIHSVACSNIKKNPYVESCSRTNSINKTEIFNNLKKASRYSYV